MKTAILGHDQKRGKYHALAKKKSCSSKWTISSSRDAASQDSVRISWGGQHLGLEFVTPTIPCWRGCSMYPLNHIPRTTAVLIQNAGRLSTEVGRTQPWQNHAYKVFRNF